MSSLPSAWTLITITASYANDDGSYPVGTVVFSNGVEIICDGVLVAPHKILGVLNNVGQLVSAADGLSPLQLPATDDPSITPNTNWGWYVNEMFLGGRPQFYIHAPHAGGTINLVTASQLTPGT